MKIINKNIKKYGLVLPKEKKGITFGYAKKLNRISINPNKQWVNSLPEYEPQFEKGWDSFGCTVWGWENAIEIMDRFLFKISSNYSERYIYNIVPIRPEGGDPYAVARAIKDNGLIEQAKLPMVDTFDEFCTPTPMTQELLNLGQLWGKEFDFEEINFPVKSEDRIKMIKDLLQYCPIPASVTAWIKREDGIFIDGGEPNCHWCVIVGFDDQKRAFLIFDSYDQELKEYDYDSMISCGAFFTYKKGKYVKKNVFIEKIKSLLSFLWK